MQPLAKKFIELLESKQLLSDEVIVELQRQVAESKAKLSPELLAKLLVENGHLTKFQASKLVAELASQTAKPSSSTTSSDTLSADEELGFTPDKRVAEVILDDEDEVVGVEVVEVIEDAKPAVEATARVAEFQGVEAVVAEQVVEPFEFGAAVGRQRSGRGDTPAKAVKVAKSKANPWDSFRILGIGTVLALVCVAFVLLVLWLLKGSAEDAIRVANERYEQRSYEDAANMYRDFARNWPTNDKASYAKVRSALASLRKDVESGGNPVMGLRTAEQVLPSIVGETALSEQQGDLTGVLIALADKFIDRIDSTKANEQRRELMAEMDKLMAIIADSKYVGSAQRTQQAPTLQKIEESKARQVREIRREDELVVAVKEMDTLLEANEVLKAYQVRKKLIDTYPLLEVHEQVKQRVLKASEIQRALVKDGTSSAQLLSPESTQSVAKSYLFAHKDGRTIGELEGTVVYYRVKGTIYAINAGTGDILWHKLVGRGMDSYPVRLGDSANPDVLISEAEAGRLHRVVGDKGDYKWSVGFGEPIHSPVVEGEDLIVTTHSGKISCLDATSGQTKWHKQLPQPVSVGPSLAVGKQLIYQPAEHSNIFVINRKDGSCKDVYYLGHLPGSIKVPPVLLLGHLFVFDNISTNSAKIRILQVGDEGLKQAQEPINVNGNIVVSPVIDRRQLLIQSDLGHTQVLDVEPSSNTDKVSVLASVPKNLDSPRQTWMAFEKNFVWLAENRLARFDLVVSSGKMDRKWIQNDGDQFVGPLQLFGTTLIHARKLRGNQGVRVSAVNSADGNKIWEVDLGEPISMIAKKQQGGFAALSSSGSYYSVTGKPLVSQADLAAGQGMSLKWFTNPVWLNPKQAVILNQSNPREFALFSESDTPLLRVLAVPFGNAAPSCPAIAAGDKAIVGLGNGQLVMFDPTTGVLVGSPYQPALKPNSKVIWNQPAFIPNSRTVVVASDQKQIVRLDASESLRQLSEEPLEHNLVGPLALVGSEIVAVQSTTSADELISFNATSLAAKKGATLDGKLIAGPFGGPSSGLLQTDQKLVSFDGEGKVKWSIDFPKSQIIGTPVLSNNRFLLSIRSGQIWVIEAETGQVSGNVDLGQPISTAPLEVDQRLLVGSDEGSILATTVPTTTTISGASQ
jgi:outer membrane protein assembly factor BamB